VDGRGVLLYHHVVTLGTRETQFGNGGRAIGQEALSVGVVDPGAGDDLRTIHGAHAVLVVLHHGVDRSGIYDPLVDQQ
jgi:hypothetical protein